jgi:HlyD family secretion protein
VCTPLREVVRVTGQRVIIDSWGGDQALEGRIRLVEPYDFTKVSALGIEEQRVNVDRRHREPA